MKTLRGKLKIKYEVVHLVFWVQKILLKFKNDWIKILKKNNILKTHRYLAGCFREYDFYILMCSEDWFKKFKMIFK